VVLLVKQVRIRDKTTEFPMDRRFYQKRVLYTRVILLVKTLL